MLALGAVAQAQPSVALSSPGSLAEALDPPADPARSPAPALAFDATFGTSLPLSVALEGRLETSFGLTAHASFGHTPAAYMGLVSAILQGAGAYPSNVAPAVAEATGNGAWNMRLGVGVMLFDGLELEGGYTLITGSSALDPSAIEVATGQPAPWGETAVPLSITIHALHVRAGWRWLVADNIVLRAGIGWTHALGSDVHLGVPDGFRMMAQDVEKGVHGAIGSYGFTPEISISAGYRF